MIELYETLLVERKTLISDLNAEVDAGVELRNFNIHLKRKNAELQTKYDELLGACKDGNN